ncbi:MAG: hypothetical protein QM607_02295 [Microbacterium sp.]
MSDPDLPPQAADPGGRGDESDDFDESMRSVVEQMLDGLESGGDGPGLLPSPIRWEQLDAGQAQQTWRELAAWTGWLVRRYCLGAKHVPPCWYLHAPLVEELTALWGAHQVMYAAVQPASAMLTWQREFDWSRARLAEWARQTNCTSAGHRANTLQPWVVDGWVGSGGPADWRDGFETFVSELDPSR